jgi:hypothetical protein
VTAARAHILPTFDSQALHSIRVKACDLRFLGGAEGIRTPDPLHAMEVRYQLRYSPAAVRCAVARCLTASPSLHMRRPCSHPGSDRRVGSRARS